jgi:hypothetical protein
MGSISTPHLGHSLSGLNAITNLKPTCLHVGPVANWRRLAKPRAGG